MSSSLKEQINKRTSEIEEIIYRFLPPVEGLQKTVLAAMDYTYKAGGKRLRPMLMDETYKSFGGTDRGLIEPFMAAIEMIHTYSLIHDDLPALDNDDYRRGKPTAHVVYGEDMAILAGDALLNYAFETAAKAFRGEEKDITVAKAFRILASKPGIYGMIGGQVIDVENTGKAISLDTLMTIHRLKTAAVIECATMIGALLAGADQESVEKVEMIANRVGLAFQIQDDILDVTSTEDILGKPVGSDEKNEKVTYVSLKGLDQASRDVESYTEEAIGYYDSLGLENVFLRDLLLSLTSRKK